MKAISSSIIVLSGAILLSVGSLVGDRDIQRTIVLIGIVIGLLGLVVWLTTLVVWLTTLGPKPTDDRTH